MDITIRFMPTEDDPIGSVERLSTPLESDVDRKRVGFKNYGGTWCLAVEMWERPGKGEPFSWRHWVDYLQLTHDGGSIADYEEWLCRTVAYIAVDGMTFWANPQLDEAEGTE